MKIRTDFVTNSSSSSFIAVVVQTKDRIFSADYWDYDDYEIRNVVRGNDEEERLKILLSAKTVEEIFSKLFVFPPVDTFDPDIGYPQKDSDDEMPEYSDDYDEDEEFDEELYDMFAEDDLYCPPDGNITYDDLIKLDISEIESVDIYFKDLMEMETQYKVESYDLKGKTYYIMKDTQY